MKLIAFFSLIILALLGCSKNQQQEKVWLENAGLVVIEAENAANIPPDSGWKKEVSLAGFHGSGYMVWRGIGDWGPESRPYDSIAQPDRILTYHVKIQTPGAYYLKVLNQHQHKDGDNDVWTSVNGSEWGKTYDWQEKEWSLDERGTWAKYPLKKGVYKVQLAGRSGGFGIDRLILFLVNTSEATLLTPGDESPTVSMASIQ